MLQLECISLLYLLNMYLTDCTAPFEVSVVTDATQDESIAPTAANNGNFFMFFTVFYF